MPTPRTASKQAFNDASLRLTSNAAQPGRQRLPVFPVRPCQVLGQLENAEATRVRPHVILRLTQCRNVGRPRFEQMTLLGRQRSQPQPSGELSDGSLVSLY